MKETNWKNPAYPEADKTIAIDFDGVIHYNNKGFHDGTCYGDVFHGAKESLKMLKGMGFKLVVYSAKARSDRPLVNNKTGKELIQSWLQENGLSEYIDGVESEKPSAFVYVDDKAFNFGPGGWRSFMRWVTDHVTGKKRKYKGHKRESYRNK